jgi:hypothetical protein
LATRSWSSPSTRLTRPDLYHELGRTYFDEHDRTRVERRLVHRLEALGYIVELISRAG